MSNTKIKHTYSIIENQLRTNSFRTVTTTFERYYSNITHAHIQHKY